MGGAGGEKPPVLGPRALAPRACLAEPRRGQQGRGFCPSAELPQPRAPMAKEHRAPRGPGWDGWGAQPEAPEPRPGLPSAAFLQGMALAPVTPSDALGKHAKLCI